MRNQILVTHYRQILHIPKKSDKFLVTLVTQKERRKTCQRDRERKEGEEARARERGVENFSTKSGNGKKQQVESFLPAMGTENLYQQTVIASIMTNRPPFELPRMEQEHSVQLAYNNSHQGWVPMTPTAPRVESRLGQYAGREAKRYSNHFDQHTKLTRKRRRNVTSLRWTDLEIGQLLGTGNFSHVYEVKLIRKEPIVDDTVTVATSSRTISTNVWEVQSNQWRDPRYDDRDVWDLVSVPEGEDESDEDENSSDNVGNDAEPACYALKHLHPSVAKDQDEFTSSVIDLVLEAKLLANLRHENIVKLHAVTEGSIARVFSSGAGYFLLLDRLYGTLEDRMEQWRRAARTRQVANEQSLSRRGPFSFFSSTKSRSIALESIPNIPPHLITEPSIEERLRSVAVGVARGLEYLHSHRIIFRDLKPSNIGFSSNGTCKIFDFGLAREILDTDVNLTANTGSLRYMAPEVNVGTLYGLSADIFSYGIMLWELCTLIVPFDGMTTMDHSKYVVHGGARPKIDKVQGSQDLRFLIQACWHTDAKKRPTSTGVRNALLMQLSKSKRRANHELEKKERSRRPSKEKSSSGSKRKLRMRLMPQSLSRYRQVDEQTVVVANYNMNSP